MVELQEPCATAGFVNPQTYIRSGNVVFDGPSTKSEVQRALEVALAKKLEKQASVMLRERVGLSEILAGDPFPAAAGNRLIVWFFETAPAIDLEVKG